MTTRWDYKLARFPFGWKGFDYDAMEKELNALGLQGWEALSTIAPSIGSGHASDVVVVLKRPAS